MAILKGTGVTWACDGVTFTGAVAYVAGESNSVQSASITREGEISEFKASNGDTLGIGIYDKRRTGRVGVMPTGTTIALTNSGAVKVLPATGDFVTFTDSVGMGVGTGVTVICRSSTLTRSSDGPAIIEIEWFQYDSNPITTLIS